MKDKRPKAQRPESSLIQFDNVFNELEIQGDRLDFVYGLAEGSPIRQAALDVHNRINEIDDTLNELSERGNSLLNRTDIDNWRVAIRHPIILVRLAKLAISIKQELDPLLTEKVVKVLGFQVMKTVSADIERGRLCDEVIDDLRKNMQEEAQAFDAITGENCIEKCWEPPLFDTDTCQDMVGQLCLLAQASFNAI